MNSLIRIETKLFLITGILFNITGVIAAFKGWLIYSAICYTNAILISILVKICIFCENKQENPTHKE